MVDIIFGREHSDRSRFVLDSRTWFRTHKKPEWFEDDFVKRFLKDVDGSTVLFEEALKDYQGRGISTDKISSGCKTLCDLYYCDDGSIFNGSMMGDNCVPFIMDIARKKDFTMVLEHYMDFPPEAFDEKLVTIKGIPVDQDGYDDAYSDWGAENDEE